MEGGSKKDKIISAALKLFSRQGYHKTTVKEIAEEADVAKGTVYWYFESKKELFRGILLSGISKLNSRIEEIVETDQEPIEKLDQIIEKFLQFFKEGKEVSKIYQENAISVGPDFKKELTSLRNEAIGFIAEVIEEGKKKKIFKEEIISEEGANLLTGMISVYNPHFSSSELTIEEKKELIKKCFLMVLLLDRLRKRFYNMFD